MTVYVNYYYDRETQKYIGWVKIDNGTYYGASKSITGMLDSVYNMVYRFKGAGYHLRIERTESSFEEMPTEIFSSIFLQRNKDVLLRDRNILAEKKEIIEPKPEIKSDEEEVEYEIKDNELIIYKKVIVKKYKLKPIA